MYMQMVTRYVYLGIDGQQNEGFEMKDDGTFDVIAEEKSEEIQKYFQFLYIHTSSTIITFF